MARTSSLHRLALTSFVICGPHTALRCILRDWPAPPAALSLDASTLRMHRQCGRFRFAATVAQRAAAALPRAVVMDASPRVVTGGVLPVTTRCRRHQRRWQAVFFRVMVVSDGAKRPTSPASLAKSFARFGLIRCFETCTRCTPWTLGDWSPLRQFPPGTRSDVTRACGAGRQ
jgi:hypothetical protein